jgi:hypothetical protein
LLQNEITVVARDEGFKPLVVELFVDQERLITSVERVGSRRQALIPACQNGGVGL